MSEFQQGKDEWSFKNNLVSSVSIYAWHSQRAQDLDSLGNGGCPAGHVKLWDGYSLLHTEDEGRAHVQDLGQAGSCLRTFDPMPFMFCGADEVCSFAHRTSQSYWLSSYIETGQPEFTADYSGVPKPMMPLKGAEVSNYISRCAVCIARGPVMAFHSQSDTQPECDTNQGWKELWTGYSFVMHSIGSMGGGQPLASPGSCLPNYRPHPYMECNADGTCHIYSDKMSYWLLANPPYPVQDGAQHRPGSVIKPGNILNHVSRCVVCSFEPQPIKPATTEEGRFVKRH